MKRIQFLLILVLISIIDANAQSDNFTTNSSSYKNAIGLKIFPGAITFKHFFTPKKAAELVSYFRSSGVRITALYETHGSIAIIPGLRWYVGPGAHVSLYSKSYGGTGSVGIDGVIGLDYKVHSIPLNLSLDWQPSFDFKSIDGLIGNWFLIAFRYTLN